MCDFKPGDEVVCIRTGIGRDDPTRPGTTYIVEAVFLHPAVEESAVLLVGVPDEGPDWFGHNAARFRKVQRLDLSAWLETAATDTDRWDKPIKAPVPLHPIPSVDALFRRIMAGGDR